MNNHQYILIDTDAIVDSFAPSKPRRIHTCQPETTKKTEMFGLRFFITPTVPQGIDILAVKHIYYNFWQAISVFMFQGECTVNLNNLFSKPSTPNLTWTNPRQSFLGNYDYASHFTYDNSSVSVRFHFLVCCSITFRCNVVDSGNMLFIQVKGTHG